MFFASDNSGPVHPQIMQAVADANESHAWAYGADPQMDQVRGLIRDLFEAPEAQVYLVATGTAANVLALGSITRPFETVFCSPVAHIHEDECNAPEFYTGGAKLTLVGGADKITPRALRRAIEAEETRGVHGPQRGPVSITQVTERGTVYALDEISALTDVAHTFGLKVHMDGARFANAVAALGCSPADMTWKRGVDVLSFGGTKNGCMGVEAVIFFTPDDAREFELRRKRGAHLFSKHRYLSAQMLGYLTDDLWLETARQANAHAAHLAQGLDQAGARFLHDVQANMIFATLPRFVHQRLHDAGAAYHLWGAELNGEDPNEPLAARFVCDWSVGFDRIDQFLALLKNS